MCCHILLLFSSLVTSPVIVVDCFPRFTFVFTVHRHYDQLRLVVIVHDHFIFAEISIQYKLYFVLHHKNLITYTYIVLIKLRSDLLLKEQITRLERWLRFKYSFGQFTLLLRLVIYVYAL